LGVLGFWAYNGLQEKTRENEKIKAEMEKVRQEQTAKENEATRLGSLELEQKNLELKLMQKQLEARDAREREKLRQEAEEARRKQVELQRRRESLQREQRELQTRASSLSKGKLPEVKAPEPPKATQAELPAAAPAEANADPRIVSRRAPRAVTPSKASLPASMQNSEVKVLLKVFVDASGKPLKAVILQGAEGCNDAAREAAISSTYAPATKDGKATTGWVVLDYNFGMPQ
jgi:FtsZ-binding cell division protein ZapB